MKDRLNRYLIELGVIFDSLDHEPMIDFAAKVASKRKLFVGGFGRTGLILQAFAIRLNQHHVPTYVLMESSTPPIEEGDLILVGSGSGTTETTLAMAKEAHRRSGVLVAITGNLLSPLGQIADHRLLIPPLLPPGLGSDTDITAPVQAGFEQALALVLEAIVTRIVGQDHPSGFSTFNPSQSNS